MPETEMRRAFQIGERLRAAIAAEPFRVNPETELRMTASVGVSTIESSADNSTILYKRADKALYVAKNGGRNRVVADAA